MLEALSQLPPVHIAFLIGVVVAFTVYPVVLAVAYVATGRDHLKRPRSAPEAAPTVLSAPRVAKAA